jgi:hypothetical protein
VHGLANGGRKGLGHIANAATNEAGRTFGIGVGEGFDAAIDLGKKVAGFEFELRWAMVKAEDLNKNARPFPVGRLNL